MGCRCVAVLIPLAFFPRVALGVQGRDHQARVWAALSTADTTARLKVRSAVLGVVQGKLIRLDATAVTLSGGGPIPLTQVDAVWRRRRATLPGGIVGAVALGAGGAYFGSFAAGLCEASSCPSQGTAAVRGALLGMGVGFALGAVIGSRFPRWQPQFP